MKKRIGTKLYDTDTAELLHPIEGGQLYQKRTRNRECFAVMNDGSIVPMSGDKPEPAEYRVRIDADTYHRIVNKAETEGCSLSQIVKKAIEVY